MTQKTTSKKPAATQRTSAQKPVPATAQRPMGEKCMMRVNSKEELDKIRQNTPFTVTSFTKDGCPHCEAAVPVIEQECRALSGIVPKNIVSVVQCPVDKEFCRTELVSTIVDDYKKQNNVTKITKKDLDNIAVGVPLIKGVPAGKEPAFLIHGNNQPSIRASFAVLRDIATKAKEQSNFINAMNAKPKRK